MVRKIVIILLVGVLTNDLVVEYRTPPTKKLIRLLEQENIMFPEVVIAQIMLETHYLQSVIYRENNNLFGMKRNSRGYCRGVRRNHCYYDTVMDSFLDYAEWQKKYTVVYTQRTGRKLRTDEDYLAYLQWIGYAEDKQYISKLKRLIWRIQLSR